MKRWRIVLLSVVLVSAVGFIGCKPKDRDDDWTFKNQSSYQVTVKPNGQSWSGFVMNPGDVRYVTVDSDEEGMIYFSYIPSNLVHSVKTGDLEITFLNN
jgi:hypothetical protein